MHGQKTIADIEMTGFFFSNEAPSIYAIFSFKAVKKFIKSHNHDAEKAQEYRASKRNNTVLLCYKRE